MPTADEDRDGDDVLRLGDGERVERRREEVVEQRARSPSADRTAGASPPTSAVATTTIISDIDLDGQAVQVLRRVERQADHRGGPEADHEAREPAAGAEVVADGPTRSTTARARSRGRRCGRRCRPRPSTTRSPTPGRSRVETRPRRLAPMTTWVAFSARAKSRIASAGVVADDGVEGAAELLGLGGEPGQPVGGDSGEAVLPRDVQRLPLAAGPAAAILAARRMSVADSGPPLTGTTMRSRVGPAWSRFVLRRDSARGPRRPGRRATAGPARAAR